MFKLTVLPCALAVALPAVAATLAVKLAIWPATARPLAPHLYLALVVAALVTSEAVSMLSTTGLPHATSVAGPTIMLVIVKLKP
jgi:hypothetical protein